MDVAEWTRGSLNERPKVFGIGFHKTGTTSLAVALYSLGYDVCGYFGNEDPDIGETVLDTAFALADHYDAVQDMPWPVLFRELDRRYPGSRFILTVRPEDRWMASVAGHFKNHRIRSHEWIYGVPVANGNEEAYLRRYRRHNTEVREYFADRPDDLLVMDLGRGDGWDRLCPFLGEPVPDTPFPSQNTARAKSGDLPNRIVGALRSRTLTMLGMNRPSRPEETPMGYAMSADFVRSMVHRHYERFDDVIAVVIADELSDLRPCHRRLIDSVALVFAEQVEAECQVAEDLGLGSDRWKPVPNDLAQTVERWFELRVALRARLGLLDDRAMMSRTGSGDLVWHLLIDMYDQGAERHARLRLVVEQHGRPLPRRPLFGAKPARLAARPRPARGLVPGLAR